MCSSAVITNLTIVVKRAKSDDALVVHGLSTEQVRALAGDLKPSTLEYWVNKGLVAPTARGSRGHRYERYWTIQDALLVLMIKALRDAGCPLQRITAAKQLIEERWDEEWRSSVLTWDGGELFSMCRSPPGASRWNATPSRLTEQSERRRRRRYSHSAKFLRAVQVPPACLMAVSVAKR
jgi:DNA-binding transcriptional MerR regulator